MKKIINIFNKIFEALFNTRAAGLYILLFAAAIGIATFIENDYGTSSAQKVVFQAFWFELLLLFFSISIVVNIVKFKMIKQKKWALVLFHGAIILILIGAGITRYFGFEGIMHIRENDSSNTFLSSTNFLKFKVIKNGKTFEFNEEVLFATLGNNNWHDSYLIENDLIDVTIKEFIPNPTQKLINSLNGTATLKVVVAGTNGREEYFIKEGEQNKFGNLFFNFSKNMLPNAINILYKNDSLFFKTNKVFTQMVMATQKKDTIYPSNTYQPLLLRSLYSDGLNNFVLPEFTKNGNATIESENPKVSSSSKVALLAAISVNGKIQETYLYGQKGSPGRPEILNFENLKLSASYGTKEIKVPFTIKLKDFILDKYPGTNSASSYASEVQLVDTNKNIKKDFRIFMNNILNYNGYRFFQSSFDKDEKGTYLSVNNDYWGTLITYIGYILLTIGLLLTFFSKKTRFYTVLQKIKKMRAKNTALIFVLLFSITSSTTFAQLNKEDLKVTHIIDINHANNFSKLVVQDFRGRMKPVHTLTREILRKLARKESLYGLSSEQIVLSMYANSSDWYDVKIVKLGKHEDISAKLGATTKYISYKDFFDQNGVYKLKDEVRNVYNLKPVDRGVYEKELLKIDEKVNILSMLFSGTLLKIVPNVNDPNNTWLSNHGSGNHNHSESQNSIAAKFFSSYSKMLNDAMHTNNYSEANNLINELKEYQIKNGGAIMPSLSKINIEILLNNSQVFSRLALLYFILGLAFLFFLFLSVFKPSKNLKLAYKILFTLVLIGFIFHTIGLGFRWYVSGRAPWSNGYESMIYIAWTSTLAGIIFTRKSFGGLAATMVLASIILLVSMLSFLDPEITPLVPVLKSYWLTIHVSLEAGSYGFLMLGAIIGIINLILMLFINESNKDRIVRIIKEMSYISELTLIGGLVMVSIGTYLGGVWANESWGRYWGWDAKETWALVTILVYAFILHMRIIPKLFGLYSYNVATIFGLASVIMTYYGVNYYLSGLHSYATGDPIPIPNWVYIVVVCLFILSISAYFKKRKFKLK
ncbi:cytochrome c-type biogenesis protein CcsB [Lutibacter oceani]|uniref:Cytochrome c-type biogenesis protein CcsB n=1 Tax=Lutibacter oceani TaxID=1853311 RepID=A0A3D9RZ59_9FLAO|nr:cytochrome c biogenesis protein CcsA [Lutibacter oceani]REE81925.1 cytochrome c-type biogenesis protein CcsB [Lutibacter oceani]